jgi:hypothetical protein
MSGLSLSGRVVRSTDLAPIAAITLRLLGPASAFAGLPNAQPVPQGWQIAWTRQLTGFAGTRWDCWTKYVQGSVPHITWQQFCDGALTHNPSLNPDHLFKADQTYLIPAETAAAPYTWSRQITNFAGSRWDCWTTYIQNQVQGITWEQFRDAALVYNPQLNADGRLFKTDKAYLIPINDATPRAAIETLTDAQGNYSFTLGDQPAICEIQAEVDQYARFVLPLSINGAITQPITLIPQSGGTANGPGMSGSVRSCRADYPSLPDKARRVIDQALFMLGDDARVFDALPLDLQKMCYGWQFLNNPNDFHYKDIVCADLVSIALKGAGLDIAWGGAANPHMADYYHPDRGNARITEITDPNDWLPGDVLVYGSGATNTRAGHVNLYVGPFSGADRSGTTYHLSDGVDVVEGSMDFMSNSKEIGTGVIGCNLQRCLQGKRGIYTWVRHVRLRELAALFGR